MRLTEDYEHHTPHDGHCRVRIFEPESEGDQHVVLLTELANNPGQSVTNCVEQLVAEIIMAHALPSSQTVFVEHYEEAERAGEGETYDLVTFSRSDPEPELRCGIWTLELGEPNWRPLNRESVEVLLRGHVSQ